MLTVRDATGAELGCSDDNNFTSHGGLVLCGLTPGETLVVWVDAYSSSQDGTFALTIFE